MLKFRELPGLYVIVRLNPDASIPDWATKADFTSITRTADELSIVCPLDNIPKDLARGPLWICLKLEGPFPFSQTGVLLSFIDPSRATESPSSPFRRMTRITLSS
ncbi:MAG: hypothetical protein WCC85_13060, partial [Candidatus Sulfotelmatobacter sp.]